ncbi:MAG TPA: DUF4232 domain-containing protein [Actinophytocola sp.]|uniref:DUF4232 domain-containing protein n=1 Tax=Actinophytocola sp. TaxID=1872138 RepID=UPI002DDCF4DE|nr:DUF4232 domain-containing protein [Actinophytocola sp.]HEV2781818.1 DUF4232 domain-containing protein [Actinophytocola sp.]
MQWNRTFVLVAAGAAVAVCAAGCTGDVAGNAGDPSVPTFTSSGPATGPITVSPPPTSSQPPATSAPTPAPPAPAPPPEPATSGECKAAELQLSIGQGEGAAGTHYRPLRFTNKGTRTCVIQGFPGVSYVAGDDGHQVGEAAFREGTKGAAVTLAPGQTAFATVGFVNAGNFDPAECRPTPTRGLRVYPPHDTAAMFLPLEGTGCAGNPPNHQLKVRTVEPGLGGA